MLIAKVFKGPRGGVKMAAVKPDRFLIVDGAPARFIAEDGTLLGVRNYVWGESKAALLKMARARGGL